MSNETVAFLSDFHVPFHDKNAVDVALSILSVVSPSKVILGGDLMDFQPLSHFDKEPMDVLKLQDDINAAEELLKRFKKYLPKAEFIYLSGNHEDRLQKFLNKTPELSPLDCLKIENLLNLKSLGISYISAGKPYKWNNWNLVHGDVVRQNAGNTAHGMITKYGSSGVNGHVHRASIVHKRNYTNTYTWVESGCLSDLSPKYMSVADWAQAFTLLTFDGIDVYPELITINNGSAVFRGERF